MIARLRLGVWGALVCCLEFAVWPALAADTDVVLSEIMIDAVFETSNQGEWVEICNRHSSTAVDLTNWTIEDNNRGDTIQSTLCPGNNCSIPARTCWLIATTQANLNAEFTSNSGNYSTCGATVDTAKTIFLGEAIGNGLANTNDRVVLLELNRAKRKTRCQRP